MQEPVWQLNVPYPFGLGVGSGGSINSSTNWFDVKCDTSFNPPKAFLGASTNIQIYDISESQMRIANFIVCKCYIRQTGDIPNVTTYVHNTDLQDSPYIFSDVKHFYCNRL